MPPEAKVFIVEDSVTLRASYKRNLELDGHVVVGNAGTSDEAIAAIDRFDELGVQVVTLDGNLGVDGGHGLNVLRAIREQTRGVKTIGLSSDEMPGVDIDVTKDTVRENGMAVLSQAITDL